MSSSVFEDNVVSPADTPENSHSAPANMEQTAVPSSESSQEPEGGSPLDTFALARIAGAVVALQDEKVARSARKQQLLKESIRFWDQHASGNPLGAAVSLFLQGDQNGALARYPQEDERKRIHVLAEASRQYAASMEQGYINNLGKYQLSAGRIKAASHDAMSYIDTLGNYQLPKESLARTGLTDQVQPARTQLGSL